MQFSIVLAAATLGLASCCALLSTERSRQHRLRGRLGWFLTVAIAAIAVFILALQWGLAVAIAAATVGLMAGIPVVATLLGWRQRHQGQRRRHAQ